MPGLMNYPHSIGGAPIAVTGEETIKARALDAMKEQTTSTMGILADFMRLVMQHANQVKDRVEISQEIYTAKINFTPLIGREYYLYERKDGSRLLSLVAPAEWGPNSPFKHCIARVKLLSDHTWEILERLHAG
jgi:hypothetical protein